ncbi:hypothetical protein [Runella sp.]|uniref:hypothetical protein n=1 Tax=Runella sp. TaxID=1960881 RepID=UPI003D0B47E7
MKNIHTCFLYTIAFTIIGYTHLCAQATRTWVSGVGDDANPCSRTAPCKTFAGAISKTAAGGEISVLDPGGFGAVTITKSITINGDGTLAGILNAGTNGIIINAGATDVVNIRSVSINGGGTGLNGIRYIGGGQVHVENCTISSLAAGANGITVDKTAKGILTVKNTTIGGSVAAITGINMTTTADTVKAFLSNVSIQGVGIGIRAQANAIINVENCAISGNTTGVVAETATSVIRLSNVTLFNNTAGIGVGLGKVYSFGNNKIAGNTTDAPMSVITTR